MNALNSLYNTLQSDTPNWSKLRREISADSNQHSKADMLLHGIIDRLCQAMRDDHLTDALVLMRQIIRQSGALPVSVRLWTRLTGEADRFALYALATGDGFAVHARVWAPGWLAHPTGIDRVEPRSLHPSYPADGMLNAMRFAWTDYQSEAQKAAVDAWIFAPPGSTTLVTLPTGAGKSLCINLPAWFDSHGGRQQAGTTIVVVPTIALALDQQRQAEAFFRGENRPMARTGMDGSFMRGEVIDAIRRGELPILFTSPESLQTTALYDVCLEAAADGLITRLVIDEAHLIETWGAGFRPEFQLLAAYRRRLMQESKGTLRTLLLSATVSTSSRDVLEALYCEPGRLITVQANRLRPEMSYWFSYTLTDAERNARVMDALRYLPRPLILYVTQPRQAAAWKSRLHTAGFHRLGMFSGETGSDERLSLLDDWKNDQLDIMIATSAFGLGVDKSDVRAVVHATLPENVDRYYQEVGRGGRDGYGMTALLCACDDDIRLAMSLNPKRITVDKAEPRWRAMLRTDRVAESGELRWIERDVVPHGKRRVSHEIDRDWNDHILLLLFRAGLIELVEAPPTQFRWAQADGALLVRILDERLIRDPAYFRTVFERERVRELETSQPDLLLSIVQRESAGDYDSCLGTTFAALYDEVQIACGGCPACRADGTEPYGGDTLDFQVSYPPALARLIRPSAPLAAGLARSLGTWRTVTLITSGVPAHEDTIALCRAALACGVQQFILPDAMFADSAFSAALIRALADENERQFEPIAHRLVPVSWLTRRARTPAYPLATLIVYPADSRALDKAYAALRAGAPLPACLHIIPTGARLASAGKAFTEHVDGLTYTLDSFIALMQQAADQQRFIKGQ